MAFFLAFWLERKNENKRRKAVYENLLQALKIEFNNNVKLVVDKNWPAILFEEFKLVMSNEIFVDNILNDKKYGKAFIEKLWDVISKLRQMKTDSESGTVTRDRDLAVTKYISDGHLEELKKLSSKL